MLVLAIGGNAAVGGQPLSWVVASDGSAPYHSVQAALDAIPPGGRETVTIHIKPGTYVEQLTVAANKPPLRLVGEDAEKTILTFHLHANLPGPDGSPIGTGKSSSTFVLADNFTAENLTFANSTPRDVAQALVISCSGDRQIFRRCRFLGWQDTIYTHSGRLYFEDCYIEGGVDFIFGAATAVFKNCEVRSKRGGYLTAASTPETEPHGYVFIGCRLTADPEVKNGSVYLGRPWRDFASVVFLDCEMGAHIRPEGWDNWKNPAREKTARYAEHGSRGPGANPGGRVGWSKQLSDSEAKAITIPAVLGGKDGWNPMSPGNSLNK